MPHLQRKQRSCTNSLHKTNLELGSTTHMSCWHVHNRNVTYISSYHKHGPAFLLLPSIQILTWKDLCTNTPNQVYLTSTSLPYKNSSTPALVNHRCIDRSPSALCCQGTCLPYIVRSTLCIGTCDSSWNTPAIVGTLILVCS